MSNCSAGRSSRYFLDAAEPCDEQPFGGILIEYADGSSEAVPMCVTHAIEFERDVRGEVHPLLLAMDRHRKAVCN